MNFARKYITIVLAMLITFAASGLNISVHDCCGKIRNVSLVSTSSGCGMHKKAGTSERCKNAGAGTINHQGKQCCSDHKVAIQKTSEVPNKNRVKATRSFDVLFVLNFIKNWFGYSPVEASDEEESSSSGISVIESLIILFRQFRI